MSKVSYYTAEGLKKLRAELDHLVESGDWEGVVLAAAKYEAAEGTQGSRTNDSIASESEDRSGSICLFRLEQNEPQVCEFTGNVPWFTHQSHCTQKGYKDRSPSLIPRG